MSWIGLSSKHTMAAAGPAPRLEIEHVLHAVNVVGVDLRDAPHLPAPRLHIGWLSAAAPSRETGFVRSQLDDLAGEQVQRPSDEARAVCRRSLPAGLLLAGQLAFGAGARLVLRAV